MLWEHKFNNLFLLFLSELYEDQTQNYVYTNFNSESLPKLKLTTEINLIKANNHLYIYFFNCRLHCNSTNERNSLRRAT